MFSLKILSMSFFVSLPPCATTFPSMAAAGREIAPYFNISIMFSSFTSSAFIFFSLSALSTVAYSARHFEHPLPNIVIFV